MTAPRPADTNRQFIHRVLIVIALVGVALLLWKLRVVVLMLFGAGVFVVVRHRCASNNYPMVSAALLTPRAVIHPDE